MMTRKNYIGLADAIGLVLKHGDVWDDGSKSYQYTLGVCETINAIVPVLKSDNSRFDEGRFRQHIEDIAQGRKSPTT